MMLVGSWPPLSVENILLSANVCKWSVANHHELERRPLAGCCAGDSCERWLVWLMCGSDWGALIQHCVKTAHTKLLCTQVSWWFGNWAPMQPVSVAHLWNKRQYCQFSCIHKLLMYKTAVYTLVNGGIAH